MRKIGETPERFWSFNTCQHKGRVFYFSGKGSKLVVTETVLGDKAEFVTAKTGVEFYDWNSGCCAFGPSVLVMTSDKTNYFAALVRIDVGRLSESTIHVTALTVEGDREWPNTPFLCQVAENRALLYFWGKNSLWYCDVMGSSLTMTKCKAIMPTRLGFETAPIRLPDGKLLVAGCQPSSREITLISANGDPTFEKVGDIPGVARYGTSTVLVDDRFVVGFGGAFNDNLDDLWIFDCQTRKSSPVRKEGEWRPADQSVFLAVQNDTLYIIGGYTSFINALPLLSLPDLIEDAEISSVFRRVVLPPIHLRKTEQEIARLTSDLEASRQEASLIPVLEAEIASLKQENQRLREDLRKALPPPGLVPVYLPGLALPALPPPPKWKVSLELLHDVVDSTRLGELEVSQNAPLLREYRTTFAPLLAPGLPRLALAALASLPGRALPFKLLGQAVPSTTFDRVIMKTSRLSARTLLESRWKEKIMDSEALGLAAPLLSGTAPVKPALLSKLPPVSEHLVSVLDKSDPLAAEARHSALSRIRRALRLSKGFHSASQAGSISEAVERQVRAMEAARREDPPDLWLDSPSE